MKTAILLGATGLTGRILLEKLLKDKRYSEIILFSRHSVDNNDPKISEYLIDLLQLEKYKEDFKADEVFCCIGTTKSKTPDKDKYKSIDYGIPVAAAQLCEQNHINSFLVISALGANADSSIFYNKIKGEMEKEVLENEIKNTYILQPSLIAGNRDEKRGGEQFAKSIMKVLNKLLIGPLKKYRSISPSEIANAMIWVANNNYHEIRVPSNEIELLAEKDEND